MSGERYVGEGRALWHFLAELRPLVVEELGDDAFLRHHIDRALKTSDLEQLRQARSVFHNHPEDLKRRLMRGIFENTAQGAELPTVPPDDVAEPAIGDDQDAGAAIRFDAIPAACAKDIGLSVGLDRDRPGDAPVKVMIKPGTLPRSAADALRQIADWIEHDRRMLSRRHWTEGDARIVKSDETVDQA
jgi:hypothetical protein